MNLRLIVLVSVFSALASHDALAQPGVRGAQSLSVGAPNDGKLVAGELLKESKLIRVVPAWSEPNYRWGLPRLVRMVERAAQVVQKTHPPAVLSVGDFSRQTGGAIREHGSHQSGRDADISFYMMDSKGTAMYSSRFVEFDGNGRSSAVPGARFDDTRNWQLVEALLTDPRASVEQIFVSTPLRQRLLDHARKMKSPLRAKAARILQEPSDAGSHADHFHVRIACPPSHQKGLCERYPRKKLGRERSSTRSGIARRKARPFM